MFFRPPTPQNNQTNEQTNNAGGGVSQPDPGLAEPCDAPTSAADDGRGFALDAALATLRDCDGIVGRVESKRRTDLQMCDCVYARRAR